MRIKEIQSQPESKLDIDNKVYIVYDEGGKEYSRYEFQHVWDSSPARNAAAKDVRDLRAKLGVIRATQLKQSAEATPLSKHEQEYIDILRKWKKYYTVLFPQDKSPSTLDKDAAEIYTDQMDTWMAQLERLGKVVRPSIISGTYTPPT